MMLPNSNEADPIFPPYTVVSKNADYALRLYDVFPVVEMDYGRREEGYASLGSYFDGSNDAGEKFAYSQPVVMEYHPDGRKVMQMYVGARRGQEAAAASGAKPPPVSSLPAPSEPGVRLNVSGGELVAVAQFDGFITPTSAEAVRRRLAACLARDGLKTADTDGEGGRFRCSQYGAVYQLGPRLNELLLRVKL
ncbi:hypothetical protein CHLRE_11g467784v5 [Chlamydomonas reinhardtii]|uniref:SOUL heme-binding protein n=1 Tax=Chlamydomonas reinhardtii TaxID=3055 RepID=A0A2K3D804_CHLRE|nr:uncharacterized protein CHLRE_11g467784v5 [Chlamydomonas reinhardtii]PNW76664.1 hypothetical protein CHLRE_11g467784v5 [Chlamydomonas reinhardtii]